MTPRWLKVSAMLCVGLAAFLLPYQSAPRGSVGAAHHDRSHHLERNQSAIGATQLAIMPVPPTTTTTAQPLSAAPTLVPNQSTWLLVHQCEGTSWTMEGPIYSGGLGFSNATWASYGGLSFAPSAGQATPSEQMTVANRIESPPYDDTPAGGCHGW